MRQGHTSTMLIKQCLNTMAYLQEKPVPSESQFPDFLHLSEVQKGVELLFVAVGTILATYVLYKYLK